MWFPGFEDLLGGLDETARNDLSNFEFTAGSSPEPKAFDDDDNGTYISYTVVKLHGNDFEI